MNERTKEQTGGQTEKGTDTAHKTAKSRQVVKEHEWIKLSKIWKSWNTCTYAAGNFGLAWWSTADSKFFPRELGKISFTKLQEW